MQLLTEAGSMYLNIVVLCKYFGYLGTEGSRGRDLIQLSMGMARKMSIIKGGAT